MIDIVFWGTHNFATKILEEIISNKFFNIKFVICAPDSLVGRHQKKEKPKVKLLAEKNNIKVLQPDNLKKYKSPIKNYALNIIVEYGFIIPQSIVDLPKFGSVNIHPSLLPLYRGSSPLQSAIIHGEIKTGISIMLIDEKMDHGPILAQEEIEINPNEKYLELSNKIAGISGSLLIKTIKNYIDGKIKPIKQNDDLATFCKIIKKEDGKINWKESSENIYNLFRGLTPWPGIWSTNNGKRIKFLNIKPSSKKIAMGEILFEGKEIFIGCEKNSIKVLKLQIEGKKPLLAKDFINGNKNINKTKMI